MVEHFGGLSLVESEVEGKGRHKSGDANIEHHEWPVTMTVAVEGIVSQLIPVWLIMGVWLVNDQVGVRIWRENVLVTIERSNKKIGTYWNMLKPFS